MPRWFPSFLCPAVTLLLATTLPDPFSMQATGASADEVQIAQADNGRDPRGVLIRGERINCTRSAPEPFDPPTTSALADVKKFLAGEHFRENFASDAEVKITWLGANFIRRFAIKIEDAAGETTIQFHTLLRSTRDDHIIDALDDRYETRLIDLWCLLRIQSNGEPGTLLINAVPNVFYVRDGSGVLGAVDAVWGGAGWEIGASPLDPERWWPPGVRVMSR